MKPVIPVLLLAAITLVTGAQDMPAGPKPGDAASGRPREVLRFELRPGEKYFREGGRPGFVLGRNPAGMSSAAYAEHFRYAAAAGERFMRVHFTFIPPGEKAGEIDGGMLQSWDAVLDAAEKQGLAVLPVLGVWADWNDGSRKETWPGRPDPLNRPRAAQRLWEAGPDRRVWPELRPAARHA